VNYSSNNGQQQERVLGEVLSTRTALEHTGSDYNCNSIAGDYGPQDAEGERRNNEAGHEAIVKRCVHAQVPVYGALQASHASYVEAAMKLMDQGEKARRWLGQAQH
jgi:hypothetical protein